jgi:crotonobetaine/carnitine-CoA ligase
VGTDRQGGVAGNGAPLQQVAAPASLLGFRAEEHPGAPWLHFEDEVYTCAEALRRVRQAANGLLDLGVRPGERFALMMANCPEFLWLHFGAPLAGATPVPVNVAQRGAALSHILRDSGSVSVICDEDVADAVRAIAHEVPSLRHLVVAGPGPRAVESQARLPSSSLLRLLDQTDAVPPPLPKGVTPPPGIAYTSGTTGPPKGVVQSGQARHGANRVLEATGVQPGEVIYTALPLFHGNALGVSVRGSLTLDAELALGRRFSASRYFDECRRYGAVEFNTLGGMIPMLLKQPARPDDRDNPVRVVLSAGCPEWAWADFERRFDVRIVEWFGMVDSPGTLLNAEGRTGSMGKPVAGVEFQVVDEEDRPLPAGRVGELVFRRPEGRLSSYHNAPDLTEDAYRGGWFHSGDLAEYDQDGFFYYRGRKKASMRRRGENISAWEVESAVMTHPAVLECAAYAVPSEVGEDEVAVVVVLAPGAGVPPEALLDHCQGRLAYYAIPRYVELVSSIPKTGTQRVDYGSLRSRGVSPASWDREENGYVISRA